VAGLASAAGCQLVASCDLAIAADTARFCTPGVNIGLFCSTPMVALARNVASKHAMEMLLTGDLFDAQDAARMVSSTGGAGKSAFGGVSALAAKIASKSTVTVRTGKEAFYRQIDMPLAEPTPTPRGDDGKPAPARRRGRISAFIGKRPPQWSDEP